MARLVVTFTGNDSTSPVSAPGVKKGDVILFACDSAGDRAAQIAKLVMVDDEIQQYIDLTGHVITALLERELLI